MDWSGGLDWWIGLVDWTGGLDWWIGLVDWTGGLDWWTDIKKNFTLSDETHLPMELSGTLQPTL